MIDFGKKIHLTVLIGLLLKTSCDPVHSLKLENKTNYRIEVLFYPTVSFPCNWATRKLNINVQLNRPHIIILTFQHFVSLHLKQLLFRFIGRSGFLYKFASTSLKFCQCSRANETAKKPD